ncbi:uncharacterized protein F5147DRAFT_766385 [Suillus discolor]|uniref:CxC2-like cysteine cluster KDZ transposase-associated domain-containing protein n=1 Tax=Suillus discolor TaxID=1912936 RepID=A0A9P7FJA0_9AGAM|nr:uncharacterized protein F5147DRAFT_766385 [Suillus discolor]KAG2120464.1 hypothetical protein F5147DRAFT_766385 [Suillus discolor]
MVGRPSKKARFSRYVDVSEAHPAPAYERFHSYGIQHDGEMSVDTTYVLSQPADEAPAHSSSPILPTVDDWNEPDYQEPDSEFDTLQESAQIPKKKRTAAENPLLQWLPKHSHFLDEIICLEGCGHEGTLLNCRCGTEDTIHLYHCRDCFGVEMVCQMCVVDRHLSNPLHHIDMWNGSFLESIMLKALGLHVQLGHTPGEHCYNAQPVSCDEFTVIDAHGIHDVAVDFCGCETAQIHYKQLLRARWFPATTTDPRTAATFSILELFHLLSFKSKVSTYEFYHSLARRSDNMGISPIKDRYSVFMRMMREWHHVLQLMHAGRGHDPNGIEATQDGRCVVPCPACLHPGMNIPDGWEDLPSNIRWHYVLFLAIDVNFQLKCKAISSDYRDPSLNSGWAYFVKEHAYKQFLSERSTEQQERSTCVSHNVVNAADTKVSRGLAATGVGHVATSTREMGPGNRRDTLDDHFSDWNWKKTTMLGQTLLRKLNEATVAAQAHQDKLTELEGAINTSTIVLWQADVEVWEEDSTKPNPFES